MSLLSISQDTKLVVLGACTALSLSERLRTHTLYQWQDTKKETTDKASVQTDVAKTCQSLFAPLLNKEWNGESVLQPRQIQVGTGLRAVLQGFLLLTHSLCVAVASP